jgi:hypothetical protein
MFLVEHLAVIAMTDHVLLIATRAHLAALTVIHAHLVVTVMIALAGLTVIHVHHVLQLKNAQTKLRVALASVAQVAKCHCRQNVRVRIG